MSDEPTDVTVEPAISEEEAEATDVELSPVGDEAVEATEQPDPPEPAEVTVDGEIQVRSAAKREIDMRIMPWDHVIQSNGGTESFVRGAFAGTDPKSVLLVGVEHERKWALGHGGQPTLARHPIGRGISLDERADGAYMTFKVANTQAGDEVLALIEDGIARNVSIEFTPVDGGTQVRSQGGRRHLARHRVRLDAVSPVFRPAYGEQAAVLAVRSQHEETAVAEDQEAPVAGAVDAFGALLTEQRTANEQMTERILARMEHLEEQARSQAISIPSVVEDEQKISKGEWVGAVLKLLTGERIPQEQMRTLDDVITSDNAGVVPPAYLTELIGVIDASRPFLQSTRRLATPDFGMQLIVPKINQRPTVAKQSSEKQELDSTKTLIGTESFNASTYGGAGDLSIQLIKRSSPSFLNLWIELLAEAYAIETEDGALRALFDAIGGGVTGASSMDPENLSLGSAYQSSFDAIRRPPDTIWLSTEAVGAFIDAKATTTNAPLYSNITASATAAGGITGTISGLRAVHVPALDAHGSFAVVGPSSGFAWAEDGTYTLQVDVPSKAGRDVALVGIVWFAPWYPAAFTAYNVAS